MYQNRSYLNSRRKFQVLFHFYISGICGVGVERKGAGKVELA
jgi:hypothetical protein